MKTKEKLSIQDFLMGTFGDRSESTLATADVVSVTATDQANQLSLFAPKPVAEIAVTLRARADGMLQACRCGGTGEDGCVIDGPLVQRDPQRGFPSHSTLAKRGNGGRRG
jgi:hypothetical protein